MNLVKCENGHFYDKDKFVECPHCGKEKNRSLCTDYKNRCGNCHSFLGDGNYCTICGTKRGEGAFAPYENLIQCIYGPMPVEREHKCPKCGYSWKNCVMIDDDKFCSKCGTSIFKVNKRSGSISVFGQTTELYTDTLRLFMQNSGKTVTIQKREVRVGRNPECEFRYDANYKYIARLQATFSFDGAFWYLQDNGSTNGTRLNNVRIEPNKKYQLHWDDKIVFAERETVIFNQTNRTKIKQTTIDERITNKQLVEQLSGKYSGKQICELLRKYRIDLAKANGIVYETSICPIIGECAGTCRRCDEEMAYLNSELSKIPEKKRKYPKVKIPKGINDKAVKGRKKEHHPVMGMMLPPKPLPPLPASQMIFPPKPLPPLPPKPIQPPLPPKKDK